MKDLIKYKAFVVGFSLGILIIFLANFYTLLPERGAICLDCYKTWGVPFAMYESGTILHLSQFIWAGVVANTAIAVVFSFLTGSLLKFTLSKFTSKELK